MKKNALIIGANSEIAFELSKFLAQDKYNLFLLSKNYSKLKKKTKELKQTSKSKVEFDKFDILNLALFNKIIKRFSQIELLIIATGFLDIKNKKNVKINKINYLGPKHFLQKILTTNNHFKEIICFTSVAGDRIDADYNEYSSAKKKLSKFIIQNKIKFRKKKIYLKDLKLGYVKTKMTNHILFQNFICSPPQKVAKYIFKNIGVKNDDVIYYPKIWLIILKIFNMFKKIHLSLKKI